MFIDQAFQLIEPKNRFLCEVPWSMHRKKALNSISDKEMAFIESARSAMRDAEKVKKEPKVKKPVFVKRPRDKGHLIEIDQFDPRSSNSSA